MNKKSRLFGLFTAVTVFAVLLAAGFALAGAKPSLAESAKVDNTGMANYIIQLENAPVASYRGGIAGYAATNPAANGESDLRKSVSTLAYAGYLESVQTAFTQTLEQSLQRPVVVKDTFQYAFNGLIVEMTAREASDVAKLDGVTLVQREQLEHILTDAGPAWIGAESIWDGSAGGVATKGEGVVVAILDTGINSTHPSFADIGGDGYDHTNPMGAGVYFGICDSQPSFCNDKLIGAYSFINDSTDPNSPEDNEGHGSHTASTVAGNVVTATIYAPTTALTNTISGVAPHANIIAYDVCVPSGCPGAALLAAAEQVVLDHMDLLAAGHPTGIATINYSISGGNNPYYDAVELAFLAATDAGVFVSASAGNSGPTPGTVAHISPWVDTVAASTHNRALLNYLTNMTSDGASLADITGKSFTNGYGPAPIVYAGDYPNPNDPGGDPGQCMQPYPAATFSGEIVICDRGTIARVDKGANVLAGGAGGLVLANTAGDGDSLVGDGHYLPAVHITYNDGVVLKAWVAANTNTMATISGTVVDLDPANGDIMASFSSRGPAGALDVLKPDITAPGVDIWAAINNNGDATPDYGFMSGTSMSSPHNAGAVALMTAVHPDWSPPQIKSAMMTTAFNAGVLKEDSTTPADPFDLGSGRVNLAMAGAAGLVLDETTANFQAANPVIGGDPNTLNVANFYNVDCLDTCSWTRTVSSTMPTATTWVATTSGPAGMGITVDPPQFTLSAYGSQMITVTVDVTALPAYQFAYAEVALVPLPEVPYLSEDFEATFPPTDWTVTNLGGDCDWALDTTGNLTGGTGAFATADADFCGGGTTMDTVLQTPLMDLSAASSGSLQFAYDWNDLGGDADSAAVDISTDGGATWTNIWASTPDVDERGPRTANINLASYVGSANTYIRFHYVAPGWDWWWQVDDVMVSISSTPAAHFPVVVYPTLPPPVIDVQPTNLSSSQDSGVMTTQPMTITNNGDSDLTWNIFENTLPINAPLVDWSDDFDSYATGSQIFGQGDWESWGGTPTDGAIVTDTVSMSAPNSVSITGPSDLVHQYSGYDTGWWIYTVNTYVPSTFSGNSYFILLNAFGATNNWSVQVNFDSASGLLVNDGASGGNTPYLTDQWVEMRVEVDLVNDVQDFYYNNALLYSGTWTGEVSGGGTLNIAAVDLFANGASPVYYDNVSLIETAPDYCDVVNDLPWVSVSPDVGTTAPAGSDVLDVTFDSDGLTSGLYEGTICVESNDPVTPLWAVPVSMTVTSDPPAMVLDASFFESVQVSDTLLTQTLTISNTGVGDLNWEMNDAAPPVLHPVAQSASQPAVGVDALATEDVNVAAVGQTAVAPVGDVPLYRRPEAVLYDNGSLVNCAGCGVGGADESVLQSTSLLMSTLGFGNQAVVGNRMADDFTVDGNGWALNTVTFFAYQSFSPTDSTMTAVNLQIWDGPPNDLGSQVIWGDLTTNILASTSWSGIYRVSESTTGANTDRPIMANVVDLGGLYLPAGTYWLDWQTAGSLTSGPWAPPITINGETTTGNAMQFTGSWAAANDGGTLTQQGMPFIIEGENSGCSLSYDIPWVSVSPISGTVVSGAADIVNVTFDATGLPGGVYTGTLCLNSNDPDMSLVTLPLTMTVLDMVYSVEMSPITATLSGMPGDVVTYTLTVTNTGNTADTFDLAVTGNTWTTTVYSSVGLLPGESMDVPVMVDIPADAADMDTDIVTVTVTSVSDGAATASSVLTTTAVIPTQYIYLPILMKP